MRIGGLAGAFVGVLIGLALAIGFWWTVLVIGLGVAGFAVGTLAYDARSAPRRTPARTRRYGRDDLAGDLATRSDPALDAEPPEPLDEARPRRRAS